MQLLGLSKKLISIESISDKPENLKKVIDIAETYLTSQDIILKRFLIKDKPSLVATMSQTRTPKIMLNSHLDVVPANPEQFKPNITSDRLYARGAIDMKASAAILMKVFKDFSKNPTFSKSKLGLMLVTDEEIGGYHGSQALLKKGYKADFVMTGESTDFNLEIAAKGVLWLKLVSKGKPAHGAYPWRGKNAIIPISQAIQNIQKLFPIPKKTVWQTTCNISSISGGNVTNRVPDYCELKLDIRYIPEDEPQSIIRKIKAIIPLGIKIEIIQKEPFIQTDIKHPYFQILKELVKKEVGKLSKFKKIHGASDARFFSSLGIPTTGFGPIGKGLHSDNEWVSLKSLSQYEKILKSFLLKA